MITDSLRAFIFRAISFVLPTMTVLIGVTANKEMSSMSLIFGEGYHRLDNNDRNFTVNSDSISSSSSNDW